MTAHVCFGVLSGANSLHKDLSVPCDDGYPNAFRPFFGNEHVQRAHLAKNNSTYMGSQPNHLCHDTKLANIM